MTLTVVLPGPTAWFDLLTVDGGTAAQAPVEVAGVVGVVGVVRIGAAAEVAILFTAGIVVWALLMWVLVVAGTAVAGRLPGAPGRYGRALLGVIAPAAAGRIIAAAVGVSLLAGTSACAVPAAAALGSSSTAEALVGQSTSATVPSGGGTVAVAPTADEPSGPISTIAAEAVIASITIDWPAPAPVDISADAAASTAPGTDAGSHTSAGSSTAAPATSPPPPVTAEPPAATSAPTTASTSDSETTASIGDDAYGTSQPGERHLALSGIVPAPAVQAPPTPTATDAAADGLGPTDATGASTAPASPTGGTGLQAPATADSPAIQVLPGDTLWSIAHHHLAPDATDEQIDTAWRAWYSANQQVIGDNPDLIAPGQSLLPPDPETGR